MNNIACDYPPQQEIMDSAALESPDVPDSSENSDDGLAELLNSPYSPEEDGAPAVSSIPQPQYAQTSWSAPIEIDPQGHEDDPAGAPSWISGLASSLTEKMFSWFPAPVTSEMKYVMGSVAFGIGAVLTSFYTASNSESEGLAYLSGFIPCILSLSSVACSFFALYKMASYSVFLKKSAESVKKQFDTLKNRFRDSDISARVSNILMKIVSVLSRNPATPAEEQLQAQFVEASALSPTPNALSTPTIIKLVTGLLSLVFTGVVSKFDWGVSNINNFLLLRERTSRFADSTKETIIGALEEMGVCDLTESIVLRTKIEKALDQAHKLRQIPLVEMLTVSTHLTTLMNTHNEIGDILNVQRKEHASLIRQYSAQLSKYYHEFGSLINEINAITLDVERPTTYGYLLEGDAGLGKSCAVQHINTCVAKIMGWPTTQYDLSRGSSGRFNKPYGYQHLGIFNEFGAGRDQDLDYLADINKILSSDPFGFESASEKQKYQPCKLRVVGFTSNRDRYDFSRIMQAGANCAMMSRFIRFEVADPLFTHRLGDNTHRLPDFSHLQFQMKVSRANPPKQLTDYWDVIRADCTISDIVKYLVVLTCKAEIKYLHDLNLRGELPDSVREAIELRLPWLHQKIEQNAVTFDFSLNPPALFNSTPVQPRHPAPQPNANNACVISINGPPCSGKSENAFAAAAKLRETLHLPVITVNESNITSFTIRAAACYILNDPPFEDPLFVQKYMTFYDSVATNNSVIILTSNHKFDLRTDSMFSYVNIAKNVLHFLGQHPEVWLSTVCHRDAYWGPIWDSNPGMIRRVGLQFQCREYEYTPASSQLTLTTERGGFYYNGSKILSSTVVEAVCEHVMKHFKQSSRVRIAVGSPPPLSPVLTMYVEDVDKFAAKMTSFSGILSLRNPVAGIGHLKVDLAQAPESQTELDIRSFMLKKVTPGVCLDQLLHTIASQLSTTVRGFTFICYAPNNTYTFDGEVLWKEGTQDQLFAIEDGIISCEGVHLMPTEFAQFLVFPQQFIRTEIGRKISSLALFQLRSYYNLNSAHLPAYNQAVIDLQKMRQPSWLYGKFTELIEFFKSPSAYYLWRMFEAICGTILVYKAYNLISKITHRLKERPNGGASSVSSSPDTRTQRRPRHMRRREIRNTSSAWTNGAPTTPLAAAIDTGKGTAILEVLDQYEDMAEMKRDLAQTLACEPSPNAVPRAVRHSLVETPFTQAVLKLKRNLFKFQGSSDCYGVFLKERFAIVPRHAFDKRGMNYIFWSSTDTGEIIKSECVLVKQSRERDLAIVRATERTLPCMRNITDLLRRPPREDFALDCFYVRPFATTEIYGGTAYYSAAGNPALGDKDDWSPTDYIEFVYSSCDVEHIYRPGDCGLPLLCIEDARVRIVGFHIAKNDVGDAWFASLYDDEFTSLTFPEPNSYAPNTYDSGPLQGFVAIPDWRPVLNNLERTSRWDNHPEITTLGFSRAVQWDIHPKPDKTCIWSPECEFPLYSLNSPTRTELIPDCALPLLPTDKAGVPQPLLAQVKKYYGVLPFKPNKLHWERAIELTTQLCTYLTGGELKQLRGHEVLNGILGSSMKRVELDSSAGPYCKYQFKVQTKAPLFKIDSSNPQCIRYAWDFDNAASRAVYADYNGILDAWSCGLPVGLIGQDVPKVELLSTEDVEAGKLRLFVVCDLAVNLALRKYFGSFVDALHARSLNTPFKIGWNPYLFPHYIRFNEREGYEIVSIDLKRQDKNMNKEFIEVLCGIVNACQKNPAPLDFSAIAKTMSRMVHIHNGVVYWQEGGNPSGNYLTTVLNTICTFLGLTYAFVARYEEKTGKVATLPDFLSMVNPAGIGDDLRYAYNPSIDLNFDYVASKFLEIGFEIVQDKGGVDPPSEHLGILCSRFFCWDDDLNVIIPALKKRSIIQQLHYANLKDKGLFLEIVQGVIFEASLHDKVFFDKIIKEAHKQLRRMRMKLSDCRIASYKAYRKHLAAYQRGEVSSPLVTSNGYELFKCSFAPNIQYDRLDFKNPRDPITAYILRVDDTIDRPPRETAVYLRESSHWRVTLDHLGYSATANSTCQASARRQAYRKLYDLVFPSGNRSVSV